VNLLEERWIPVRRASGKVERIAPYQVTDRVGADPVVALDAPRPDFNGALVQFLIGLVQTAWVFAGEYWDREEMLWAPPSPDALQGLFTPLRTAFELDGDGPRFMQDLTLGPDHGPTENEISALLIDFPGAQSVERNADLFVKRHTGGPFCLDCAATALFCLMTNAPSGGAGHRTSIRGGGPLTTLIAYAQKSPTQPEIALWRTVACNVLEPGAFAATPPSVGIDLGGVFPWLRSIELTMRSRGQILPLDVHPLQMFWAMPRRVRLEAPKQRIGECAVCSRPGRSLVSRYITKNYGLNYKGPWRHPLSPYYRSKPTDPSLPVHVRPDGMTYRHWLGWAVGSNRSGRQVTPATVVQSFQSTRLESGQVQLWAFGYDMDNMKARCWYETTFPLFDLPAQETRLGEFVESIVSTVDVLVAGAESVAQHLRYGICQAWLGDNESTGDLGFVEASFWNRSEREFFTLVERAITLAKRHGRDAYDRTEDIRREWLEVLRRAALGLFDEVAARAGVEDGNPARISAAHRTLRRQLYGERLQQTLGLISASDHNLAEKRRKKTEAG
jgi:CRISPR system Cascade subunit CasA